MEDCMDDAEDGEADSGVCLCDVSTEGCTDGCSEECWPASWSDGLTNDWSDGLTGGGSDGDGCTDSGTDEGTDGGTEEFSSEADEAIEEVGGPIRGLGILCCAWFDIMGDGMS